MSQFVEKNQRFGTVDLVIMVALLGVVVSISQAIVGEVCTDHRRLEARMKAESLAFRLAASDPLKDAPAALKKPENKPDDVQSRGPASADEGMAVLEGQIGEDPWGHPYRYSLKKDALGKVSEVSVWSSGPGLANELGDAKKEDVSNGNPIRYVYTAPLQSRNRLVPAVSN